MDVHEREYLTYRILSGYVRIPVLDFYLKVNSPTLEQIYKSNDIYKETFDEAWSSGVMVDREIMQMIVEKGFWTPTDIQDEKQLPKDIEDAKVDMFKALFDVQKRERHRRLLRGMEKKLKNILTKKTHYDSMGCGGTATYAKWNWLIEECTTYDDGTPYDWQHIGVSTVLYKYQQHALSETDIREIARNDPWRTIWASGKNTGGVFDCSAAELSEEQKAIGVWSRMYDGIQEHPECPTDEVIDDDDLLDGWLIMQRRERETQAKTKRFDSTTGNEKLSNADEVFVVARSEQDVADINDLNTEAAKYVKSERSKTINESQERLKDAHLPDVNRRILRQANEQFKSRG